MTKKPINWIVLLVLLCRCHVQTAPQSQLLMRSKIADLALSLTGLPYRSGGQIIAPAGNRRSLLQPGLGGRLAAHRAGRLLVGQQKGELLEV